MFRMQDTGISKNNLMVRADTNVNIGMGHIMRCLALAQAWQDVGGHVAFVMCPGVSTIDARLREEGIEVWPVSAEPGSAEDAFQLVEQAMQRNAAWIVIDGYHFGGEYQRIVKESGLHVLCIDDHGRLDYYHADCVLNQNIHADEGWYKERKQYSRLLLGTRYALLRREFLEWKEWKRQTPRVARNILITLGGSDRHNMSLKMIQGLAQVDVRGLEAVVVVGAMNPHFSALEVAARRSRTPIRLESNISNMPELMAWADVAIVSVGSTLWEMAFLRLPSLVVAVEDDHLPIAEHLEKVGVSLNLGWHEEVSSEGIAKALTGLLLTAEKRGEMAQNCRGLVDGEGADRVVMHIKGENIRLRTVREDDCKLLWEWANDPVTRAVSFSPDPIAWEQHIRWFDAKFSDPNCIIYIAVSKDDAPVGQVRYDTTGEEAVISVSIDKRFRGEGYGSTIIRLASQRLLDTSNVTAIHAYMRKDNEASYRAFVKSGYRDVGKGTVHGDEAHHLLMQRS